MGLTLIYNLLLYSHLISSGRDIRPPARYTLLGDTYKIILGENEGESSQLNWSNFWHGHLEMTTCCEIRKSMYRNQVQKFVGLPSGIKFNGCKLVYRKNGKRKLRLESLKRGWLWRNTLGKKVSIMRKHFHM